MGTFSELALLAVVLALVEALAVVEVLAGVLADACVALVAEVEDDCAVELEPPQAVSASITASTLPRAGDCSLLCI
ncbi:MAG TPA: hypothetical protein VIC06_09235 [Solirubrobacteraceae bacterium]